MSESAFNSGFSRTNRHTTSSLVAQLSPNTHPNLAAFRHLNQPLLNGNADVSALAARSITMYDFEKGMSLLSREADLTIQPLQRLRNMEADPT